MTVKRPLSVLILALTVAAIAAPAASARPADPVGVPLPSYHAPELLPSSPPVSEPATQSGAGFDWGDAGIGAGATVALLAIGLGGVLVVSARRHDERRSPAAG